MAPVFYVHWSREDREWVGTTPSEPFLSWLSESPAAALQGIKTLVGH